MQTSYLEPRDRGWFYFLAMQLRVIEALVVREVYTRFGRHNIGFMWIVIEPALLAVGVVILWSLIKHGGHEETPIVPLLLTGYMPLSLYRHMSSRLQRSMQANSALLYHRQISVFTIYVGRIVVEFFSCSFAFIFLMFIFYLMGMVLEPDNIGTMLGGWFLYAWYSAAVGLCVGALSERSELVEKFWGVFSYLQIPISGTFFMVYWMPAEFREFLTWMPPINGVEMIRCGYFGPAVPTFFSPSYFSWINAIITVIGLWLLKDSRRYVEIE